MGHATARSQKEKRAIRVFLLLYVLPEYKSSNLIKRRLKSKTDCDMIRIPNRN